MIKAYVGDHHGFAGGSVNVFVVRSFEDGSPKHLLHLLSDGVSSWDEFDEATIVEPTFRLPHEAAHAVLQALAAHYGGVDDMRTLRRDYDAERKRVDKLTDTVSGIAAALARTETR